MIHFTRPLPQLGAEILQRAERNRRKFSDLGIDSRPDVISFENVEYVAQLLAQERALLGYVRNAQDWDILMRVCDQFLASGIPALEQWAISQLTKDKQKLEKEIQNCQVAISAVLDRLEADEKTDEHRPYEGDYPEVVALGDWERQRRKDAKITVTS